MRAGEAGAEESERHQGDGAYRLPHAIDIRESRRHGFEEEGPRAFLHPRASAGRSALDGSGRGRPGNSSSSRGETAACRLSNAAASARCRSISREHAAHVSRCCSTPIFFVGHQLAVKVKRNELRNRIARHTKSPNTERIFWVARKRQFLAASSVVPNISPIFRNRNPW